MASYPICYPCITVTISLALQGYVTQITVKTITRPLLLPRPLFSKRTVLSPANPGPVIPEPRSSYKSNDDPLWCLENTVKAPVLSKGGHRSAHGPPGLSWKTSYDCRGCVMRCCVMAGYSEMSYDVMCDG